MHRLENISLFDDYEDENIEFYSRDNYLEKMFYTVVESLTDKNGLPLKGRVNFKPSYFELIEKCNIENSMDIIYKLLNQHISSQDSVYFKDNEDSSLPQDVEKVLEFMRHLYKIKIPKRFVGGFLILMTKFVYFTPITT